MFDLRPGYQKEQEERYLKALGEARIRAMNGPNADKMIAGNDDAFWNYAGKSAPASTMAAAQMATDPAVASLRAQGQIGAAGLQSDADMYAAEQRRAGGNEAAGLAGEASMYGADQRRAGGNEAAAITGASHENAANIVGQWGQKGTDANVAGRLGVAQLIGKQAMEQLVAKANADALLQKQKNAGAVAVAGVPRQSTVTSNFSMGAGGEDTPQVGQRKQMPGGAWAVWNGTTWVEQ